MFSYIRDKMRNARIQMSTDEVLWFVESLAPMERNFALLKATEFRLLTTNGPETFALNDVMMNPGRSSIDVCFGLFTSMEEMYGVMLQQKATTEAQLRRMGMKGDELSRKVATELNAVRIWMANVGCRVNPNTLSNVKKLWSLLLEGIEENLPQLKAKADRGELSEMAIGEIMAIPVLDVDERAELIRKMRGR